MQLDDVISLADDVTSPEDDVIPLEDDVTAGEKGLVIIGDCPSRKLESH
jgi:hypothetical protein